MEPFKGHWAGYNECLPFKEMRRRHHTHQVPPEDLIPLHFTTLHLCKLKMLFILATDTLIRVGGTVRLINLT